MSAKGDIELILDTPNITRELATDAIRRARATRGHDSQSLAEFSDELEKLMPKLKKLPSVPPPACAAAPQAGGGGAQAGGGGAQAGGGGAQAGGGGAQAGGAGPCDNALKMAAEALATAQRAEEIARTTATLLENILVDANKIGGELRNRIKDKHTHDLLDNLAAAVLASRSAYDSKMVAIGSAPGASPLAPIVPFDL